MTNYTTFYLEYRSKHFKKLIIALIDSFEKDGFKPRNSYSDKDDLQVLKAGFKIEVLNELICINIKLVEIDRRIDGEAHELFITASSNDCIHKEPFHVFVTDIPDLEKLTKIVELESFYEILKEQLTP